MLSRVARRNLARAAVPVARVRMPMPSMPLNLHRQFVAPRQSFRFYSVLSSESKAKIYSYEDVKELTTNPDKFPNTLLLDVREPVEFHDGHIPNALNVPFKSSPGALDLSPEDFEESFGFEKPDKTKELVFYCLGGVRSTAAEELANTFGYEHRGNYVGSWEDWVSHENAKQ